MNIQHVISIAAKTFGDIEPIKEGLYRGQMQISNKPAGVYFLDFNQEVTLENFNAYQENLLANEYYNLESNQQWNFYLFLLRDTIDINFKSEVEKNDRYARKYVFKENEFEEFFTIDKSTGQVKTTLIDEWKKKLDDASLTDVYGDTKPKEILQKLDAGVLPESTDVKKKTTAGDVSKIKTIRKLVLKDSYRLYPTEPRVYEFRKVNLIKGINGSGKTSLFEAIEIAICGMAFRNPTHKEKDGCVEAWFNDSKLPEVCKPTQVDKYRKRDVGWYGSTSTKLNRLHYSFSRFNFFNADAAHRFSSSSSEEDIRKALFNIILGPEYDFILDRVEKLLKEIRPIYSKLEIEYKEWSRKKQEADDFVKGWKENQSLKKLAEEINNKVTNLKPITPVPSVSESHIEAVQFLAYINLYTDVLLTNNISSLEIFQQKGILLTEQKEKLEQFRKTLEEIEIGLLVNQERNKALRHQSDLLSQTKKYFTNESLFNVEGLQKRMVETEAALSKIRSIRSGLEGINLDTYNNPQTLTQTIEGNDELSNEYKKELQTLENDVRLVLEKMETVQKTIKEIKLLGQSYMEAEPSAHACPLCDADFTRDELFKRIYKEENYETDLSVSGLSQKNERIQELKKNVENLRFKNDDLFKIKVAWEAVKPVGNAEEQSLTAAIREIQKSLSELTERQTQYEREKGLQELIQQSQITEDGFNYLKQQLAKVFPGEEFSFSNQAYFLGKESSMSDELYRQDQEQQIKNEKRAEASVKIKTDLLLATSETFTLTQLQQVLIDREKENVLVNSVMEKLQQVIVVDGINLKEIQLAALGIQSNIEIYKSGLTMESKLHEMKEQQSKADSFLRDNKEKFDRYRIAFEVLNTIKDNSADDQVNIFFKQHLEEIIDVFKTIHTPREFKDITIDEKGTIKLYTIKNEEREITQISTGQRSALAISIFLTLNRSLQNGPDIILFDDPVAFIDDLNALSFLDYLRFFVLKENKQIFFATANLKLSSLFEKKFQFLDEDFRKWELKRPN